MNGDLFVLGYMVGSGLVGMFGSLMIGEPLCAAAFFVVLLVLGTAMQVGAAG